MFRDLLKEAYERLIEAKTIEQIEQLKRDWKHTMKIIDRELWHV